MTHLGTRRTSAQEDALISESPRRRQPLVLFLLGLIVSVLGSWRPSLWTDEAATISAARRSLPELVAMAGTIDAVHATYYACMHGWVAVFGATELALRLPSAVAVGLTTVGVWWLGRRLSRRSEVATLAALAFVILPRTTWMGEEARPYAFSALLAVASTLLLVVLTSTARVQPAPSVRLLVLYGLLAAAAIAINIYLALLLVAHGLTLLLDHHASWRFRRHWLIASLLAVAVASPVVWLAIHQTGQLGGGDFGLGRWLQNVVVNQWFLGETPTSTGAASGPLDSLPFPASVWKPAAVCLALLCWAVVAFGVLRFGRSLPVLRWTLPWAVVPSLVVGLYSISVHDMYNPRYFSYATPAIALLLGHGLAELSRRWVLVVVSVVVVVLTIPVYASQRTQYAKSSTDWSGVAAFVNAHRGPGQGVYFSPRYPVTGPLVGQTARGVRVAYPSAFDGLLDVTLLRTPVQDHNLSGTSRLLADSTDQLARVSAVWVVRRNDYAYAGQDDRTLAAAGFVPGRTWQGPLDRVLEFTRA